MPRKGYRKEGEYVNIVLGILPRDSSPMRWTQLWSIAKRNGIGSKETLSKRLGILVDSRRILQDEDGYRLNPNYGEPYDRTLAQDDTHVLGADLWDQKPMEIGFHEQNPSESVAGHLPDLLEIVFEHTLKRYMEMLKTLTGVKNITGAKEIFNLFVDADIYPLRMLAYQVWAHRNRVTIPNQHRTTLRIGTAVRDNPTEIQHIAICCADCGEEIAALHRPVWEDAKGPERKRQPAAR